LSQRLRIFVALHLARDRIGGWHAHVTRNKVEIAVSVDKGGRITAPKPTNGGSAD
jgi:hypothetical protein